MLLTLAELEPQRKPDRFFDMLDKLQSLEPRITVEEIDAEIEAYRRRHDAYAAD